jgi:hypothetical protein
MEPIKMKIENGFLDMICNDANRKRNKQYFTFLIGTNIVWSYHSRRNIIFIRRKSDKHPGVIEGMEIPKTGTFYLKSRI